MLSKVPLDLNKLIVSDLSGVREVCRVLTSAGQFAIDTEFIRERSYQPQLCLVQVATADFVALLDPLAVDLSEVWQLVTETPTVKIAHAGTQDWEMCFLKSGKPPVNIFDVQVAAGLAGLPYPSSYGKLVQHVIGQEIPQGHSFSDWTRRPLTLEQLEYAAADVTYLTGVYDYLRQKLGELGRLEWLKQEMEPFEGTGLYFCEARDAWRKVKGIGRLEPRELAVLRELAAWREKAAQQADLPARTFLADGGLVAITLSRPVTAAAIAACKFVPRPLASEHWQEILDAIQVGLNVPATKLPRLPKFPMIANSDKALIAQLVDAGATYCLSQSITPEVFAAKHNYTELVRVLTSGTHPKHTPRLLTGWRRDLTVQILQTSGTGLTVKEESQ